jgi:hypothetical protein
MNLKSLFLGIIFLALAAPVRLAHSAAVTSCTTSREYITTLEFLRDRKELAIAEPDAQKVALEASKGCTGAAQRFVRVAVLLEQAGLGPKDTIRRSLEFAHRTDQEADTFATVFRLAFDQDAMDLDLRASMKMAEELTQSFDADTVAVRDDFEKLLDFCASSGKLGLPKPECGAFAARLAKEGEKWSGGISVPYIEAFDFVTSEKGPHLATSKALEIAGKLVAAGPDSADNFITAYKYAVSKKGLGLADNAALKFAMQMGLESGNAIPEPSSSK